MWHNINPIVIREIRGRMRSPRAFWLLAGFLGAVASTMLLVYTASDLSSSNRATASSDSGSIVFLTLIGTAMLVLLVLTTILSASSIAGERERQTFDLLLTSQLSAGAIVVGKICATMAYGGLLLSAMTPLIAIPLLIGGVDTTELLIMYAVVLANMGAATCCGVYWSSRASSPLIAIGMSLACVFGILVGIPIVAFTVPTIWQALFNNADILQFFAYFVLPIHPIATLILTNTAIREQAVWLTPVSFLSGTPQLPAMWIVSIIESWLISLAFIAGAIRRLWPTR